VTAYYNEIEPFACKWLRNLMAAGHIMPGEVDARSIKEVRPQDVQGFTRVHFFAGVAGWDFALRLAGWPTDVPVWTGSAPCQPFSDAGKKKGEGDERHLWPEMFRLVRECRPAIIFGEQVASNDGLGWLDGVFTDLEGEDYTCGAVDLPAASVQKAQKRQRLWWTAFLSGVAYRSGAECGRGSEPERQYGGAFHIADGSAVERLAVSDEQRDLLAGLDDGSDVESVEYLETADDEA